MEESERLPAVVTRRTNGAVDGSVPAGAEVEIISHSNPSAPHSISTELTFKLLKARQPGSLNIGAEAAGTEAVRMGRRHLLLRIERCAFTEARRSNVPFHHHSFH